MTPLDNYHEFIKELRGKILNQKLNKLDICWFIESVLFLIRFEADINSLTLEQTVAFSKKQLKYIEEHKAKWLC